MWRNCICSGLFPYDDDIFDDGPNENYVGSPKMQEIHDKLEKFKVTAEQTSVELFQFQLNIIRSL